MYRNRSGKWTTVVLRLLKKASFVHSKNYHFRTSILNSEDDAED